MMKAVKNETEIANTRLAYLKDGCAEAEFYGWLFEALEKGETVTEWKCSQKIAEFRAQQKHYVSESFTAIIAYRENAAMMHYAPLPQACSTIERENMLLNDSGGQYRKVPPTPPAPLPSVLSPTRSAATSPMLSKVSSL